MKKKKSHLSVTQTGHLTPRTFMTQQLRSAYGLFLAAYDCFECFDSVSQISSIVLVSNKPAVHYIPSPKQQTIKR